MDIDQNKLDDLRQIVERHFPTSIAPASEIKGYVVGRAARRSDMHALLIYSIVELNSHFLGASPSQVEPGGLAKALMSARAALADLSSLDRQKLLTAAYPGKNQNEFFGHIDEMIDELAILEKTARGPSFRLSMGPPASRKRKWHATAAALACISTWQQELPDCRVPEHVEHDAPGPFGKFLNDVLIWAGERREDGKGSSAATALRSLRNLRTSQ